MNISVFKHFNQVEANLDLSLILDQIRSGKYKVQIQHLRELISQDKFAEYNEKKRALPAFTPSGLFEGGRKLEFLKEYSGCLVLDIDKLSRDHVDQAKAKIIDIPYTYSCFLSPSGQGLKILVKVISRPVFHKQTFEQVKEYYEQQLGLPVDPSGKDVTRLCFVSWDEDLYLNHASAVFKTQVIMMEDDIEKVVRQIESRAIDITSKYDDWLKLGFSLSDALGEEGRPYFHKISRFYPGYDIKKCNDQFDDCLASTGSGITAKTFFYLARDHGIDISSVKSQHPPQTSDHPASSIQHPISPFPSSVSGPRSTTEGRQRHALRSSTAGSVIIGTEAPEKPPSKAPLPKWVEIEQFLSDSFEFRNNIVAHVIEYSEKTSQDFREINENSLHRFLQISGIKFSLALLKSLLQSDFIPEFDPFVYYFESLPPWDGHTDHIFDLANFVKAKDQLSFNHHLEKMLVRCVACALNEYYYNKQAFIIVGHRQNTGKSTFIRFLCPPALNRYLYENISTDKDAMMCLSENFIINLDELAIFDKKEINYLKSLLSKDRVKIRRPFATRATSDARRASFFGSTNNNVFLTDETGSVRWLCFEIESIDFQYTEKIDIDLVWAQAYSLYKNGFKYELTAEEIRDNEQRNEQFQHLTLEYELIQKTFIPGNVNNNYDFMTASDILRDISETYNIHSHLSPEKVGKALSKLGFQKIMQRRDNQLHPVYGYFVQKF
jgi:hypothetical protein